MHFCVQNSLTCAVDALVIPFGVSLRVLTSLTPSAHSAGERERERERESCVSQCLIAERAFVLRVQRICVVISTTTTVISQSNSSHSGRRRRRRLAVATHLYLDLPFYRRRRHLPYLLLSSLLHLHQRRLRPLPRRLRPLHVYQGYS